MGYYLPVLNIRRRLAYAILGFQISGAPPFCFLQSLMGNYDVSTGLDFKLSYCVKYNSASNRSQFIFRMDIHSFNKKASSKDSTWRSLTAQ